MAKIVTVYDRQRRPFVPVEMSYIRWLKISEALAKLGHEVHIATHEPSSWLRSEKNPVVMQPRLTRVPIHDVLWAKYDVVKTLFHIGFESLESFRGTDHPFIISKLGSVVGPSDTPGIPFYGKMRERLYSVQQRIHAASRYVTVLSIPAKELWEKNFLSKSNVLLVPGATDSEIPGKGKNPFPEDSFKKCIFAGNVYIKQTQRDANRVLVHKLNALGRLLSERGIRLYMIGTGDVTKLDKSCVRYMGAVPYDETWDFFYHADVGVVLNPGTFLHNNESSKIYHYLRAGLPVVSEKGFPNDFIVSESCLGSICENGNIRQMADQVEESIRKQQEWDRHYAVQYILQKHTWDERALIYDRLIRKHFQ